MKVQHIGNTVVYFFHLIYVFQMEAYVNLDHVI